MAPITNVVIRAFKAADEAANTNISVQLPYCFPPFASTAPTNSPLVLWLVSAVVIIPLGLVPISISLAPDFFRPLTALRRPKNFVPTMINGKITLPPLEPGSAFDMKSKACLRFLIGLGFAATVIALAALHALGVAGVMFCSGDNWKSGLWALPWAEWVFVSAALASGSIWAVFLLAQGWYLTGVMVRNARKGKKRASDEETPDTSISTKKYNKNMKSRKWLSHGLPGRAIPMKRIPVAHFPVLESIEEEKDKAPSSYNNHSQIDNGEGSSSMASGSGPSSARGSRSSGGSDSSTSKKSIAKPESKDMPRIMITQYDPEESRSSKHSSSSSAGIPIKDLDPPVGTYLPKIPEKNAKRESTTSTNAEEEKVLPT
ncbi:hypothetical protein MMC17_002799 [Xylographa soralifera]|nr:hypothetical protein [Xylographa soralifera]